MSSVDRLKGKMPSIHSLNDVLLNLDDTRSVTTTEPARLPSIWERITMSRVGLVMPDDITADEWQEVAKFVIAADDGLPWLIGATINRYKAEWGWGETYQIAHEMFPRYKIRTLQQFAYVDSNVRFSFRKENLSWAHHLQVAKDTDQRQREHLQKAADNGWSVAEFKAYLRNQPLAIPSSTQVADREWVMSKLTKLRAGAIQAIVKGDDVTMVFYQQMKADADELMGRIKALVTD